MKPTKPTIVTKTTEYKLIRTQETKDKKSINGARKRQYKLQILKDKVVIKSMYFLDKNDRNSAYRGFMKLLEVSGVV